MKYTEAYVEQQLGAIQRVRELHKPFTYEWDGFQRVSGLCMECEQDCPCDTIKALDGEQ